MSEMTLSLSTAKEKSKQLQGSSNNKGETAKKKAGQQIFSLRLPLSSIYTQHDRILFVKEEQSFCSSPISSCIINSHAEIKMPVEMPFRSAKVLLSL